MYSKIQIKGVLEVKTGMHIGGSSAFSAIGAVDSPVIKDIRTNNPMIPGSSLKGKMRTLLARKYNDVVQANANKDADCIIRVFGSSEKDEKGVIKQSRVLVSDMFIINGDEIRNRGISGFTEVKFENSINRTTAVAMPRQIERAIKGLKFGIDIIYEAESGKEAEIEEDIALIAEGMKMLEYDYLGGNGSRGYGKVKFENIDVNTVIGEFNENILSECKKLIKEVGC